jgi:O-antigen ligase
MSAQSEANLLRPAVPNVRRRAGWQPNLGAEVGLKIGLLLAALALGIALAYIGVHWSFRVSMALVIGAGLAWWCIRDPEFALLLVVLSIPFEDYNAGVDLGPFSPVKLLGIAAIGAFAINYLAFQHTRKLVYRPENIYVILIFMAAMVSNFVAIEPELSLDKTFKLLRVILFYFLVINIVRTRPALHRVLWMLVITGLIAALIGLYEYQYTPELLDERRIDGTYDDALGFAYACTALIPIVWYLFKTHTHPAVKAFLAVTGGIFLVGIVLSGTRSGMAAAAAALLLIALREKRPALTISLAGLVFLAAYIFMPAEVQARLGLEGQTSKAAEASNERRVTYYEFGLQLFLQKPILGMGMGGFAEAYSQSEYGYLQGQEDVRRIAHNMYLEFAIGAGLTGLLPFLLLLGVALAGLQKATQHARASVWREAAKAIQVSLLAYLFIGLFSSSQYDKPLWLLIGLAAILPTLEWGQASTNGTV